MAPSRRAAAASNAATKVRKLASSSKSSTKTKVKASSKRSRSRKDLSKSSARSQAVKQAVPSGTLAGGSNNASGHNNGRRSNSQRTTGATTRGSPRRAMAAKSGSQAQSQRNSGRKPKAQRLTGVSVKSAPLKPTRRFNAEAPGNRKPAQNTKKTKSTIKAGKQAGTAKRQRSTKVHAQSKENGHVESSLGAKAKKKVGSARKSAYKAANSPAPRKLKAPKEDPAIIGDENVEMLVTDTRVEPVRLPLEPSKEKVVQGGVQWKLWYVEKYLATMPAQGASLTQETGRYQETTANEVLPHAVRGQEEDLEDCSSESSSSESSLGSYSCSTASIARRDSILRQLIEEQRKLRLAYGEAKEQEFKCIRKQIELLEAFTKRWETLVSSLDKLRKK